MMIIPDEGLGSFVLATSANKYLHIEIAYQFYDLALVVFESEEVAEQFRDEIAPNSNECLVRSIYDDEAEEDFEDLKSADGILALCVAVANGQACYRVMNFDLFFGRPYIVWSDKQEIPVKAAELNYCQWQDHQPRILARRK
jgi:hypothetical protein